MTTPNARTVLPTDLVALVSYDGRVYANQAITLDRIGTHASPHPLEAAFEQWLSFATGRHTWISVKGPTLRGLVSARKRGSKLAWEIDCLIDADEGDDGVLMSLLDQVTEAAGKSGAHKIFVRLPAASMIEEATRRCAFGSYSREHVYTAETSEIRPTPQPSAELRRRAKEDAFGLFQLYNAVVPEQIRRFEAMTFMEWTASQERLGRTTQYVLERDDTIVGWLRISGDGDIGRFAVVGQHDAIEPLIDAAIAKLANRERLYLLVPEYESGLGRALEDRGFEAREAYSVLSRRTVRPVKAPKAVPAVVRTTFG